MSPPKYPGLVADLRAGGVKVRELAQAAGMHRSTIYRLADGSTRRPFHDTVTRLEAIKSRTSDKKPDR